jgi:hypothetical protein
MLFPEVSLDNPPNEVNLELMNCSSGTREESKDETSVTQVVSNSDTIKKEDTENTEAETKAIKDEKEEEDERPVTRRQKRGAQEIIVESSIESKKRHISQSVCAAQKSSSHTYISPAASQPTTVTRQSSRSLNSTPKKEPVSGDESTGSARHSPRLVRSQQRNAEKEESLKAAGSSTSINAELNTSDSSTSAKSTQRFAFVTVKTIHNKKIHTCDKCGLEFTSPNSVIRHQEKSCLRVRVINIEQNGEVVKKKCPICSSVFFNTHRLSIHIYKHHKNLLGSVFKAASSEALRLNEIQLKKLSDRSGQAVASDASNDEFDEMMMMMDEEEEEEEAEDDAEFDVEYDFCDSDAHVMTNEASEDDSSQQKQLEAISPTKTNK